MSREVMSCGKCRFWDDQGEDGREAGLCCRHAPTIVRGYFHPPVEPVEEAIWPQTDAGDWCGEFEEKKEDKKDDSPKLRRSAG